MPTTHVRDHLIRLENVTFRYGRPPTGRPVLDDLSMTLSAGGWVAIMGTSGSGKSTLLKCCAGLLRPSSGTVTYCGTDLESLSDRRRSLLRRRDFGFIFQEYNLLDALTVAQNVELPMLLDRAPDARPRAAAALAQVALTDVGAHLASDLSGGQRQRVAIARALAQNPSVLFADEPTGALDSRSSHEVMSLFDTLRSPERAILTVTHDPSVAALADVVIIVADGTIALTLEGASPTEISSVLLGVGNT